LQDRQNFAIILEKMFIMNEYEEQYEKD